MKSQSNDVPRHGFGTEVLAVIGLLTLFKKRGWM
jgi:hypothetical protein